MSKGKWKKKNPLLDYTYQNINKSNTTIKDKWLINLLSHLYKQSNKIPYILFLNEMTLNILNNQAKKLNTKIETLIIYSIINQNKETWIKYFKNTNNQLKPSKEIKNFKNQLEQISKINNIGNKQEQHKTIINLIKKQL